MSNIEKPILRREDVEEMYDRYKLSLYDMAQISQAKDCHITIRISPDGEIEFEAWELTEDKFFTKTVIQGRNRTAYEEKEYNR